MFTGQPPTLASDSYYFRHLLSGWTPYDRAGVRLHWRISTRLGAAIGTAVRRRLALPRLGAAASVAAADAHPVIVAASPWVVPPAPDWPSGVRQTGYLWAPERSYVPSDELASFLDAGPPPVYVGFGSMAVGSAADDLALVLAGARAAGVRLITPAIAGVRAGRLDEAAFAVDSVPHEWLLPQMAGVVHHGGAGTTHDGLRAGVPSVAVPFGMDQPYHAWRLHRLGVGPAPVPLRKLTVDALSRLLRDLVGGPSRTAYADRARSIGAAVDAEDGVGSTIALLDRLGYLA